MFEFYQEIQRLKPDDYLNPPFPILIYNGNQKWTAPERFSELLYPSAIPKEYLPEFRYFKIAINEIPKRELVKIRNAVSAIFYIENSTPEDIAKNRKELVSLLAAVLKKEGVQIVREILDRILMTHKVTAQSKTLKDIQDLTEVSSMWETSVKEHEKKFFQKGIEQGIEKGIEENSLLIAEKMILRGMENRVIHEITGISMKKIADLRKKRKK
jgi:predicted transposase/invertase (TIGR01784 family)